MSIPRTVPNPRRLKVYLAWGGAQVFPFIRLVGRWVAAAGFHVGDSIQITVIDGEIRIAKVADSPNTYTTIDGRLVVTPKGGAQ